MTRLFDHFSIYHYRSISECTLIDLQHINVLIGPDQVSKTSLMDAISMFTIPELASRENVGLNDLIQLSVADDLFYKKSLQFARVSSNRGEYWLRKSDSGLLLELIDISDIDVVCKYTVDNLLRVYKDDDHTWNPLIRGYKYSQQTSYASIAEAHLSVPAGDNLLDITQQHEKALNAIDSLKEGEAAKLALWAIAEPSRQDHYLSLGTFRYQIDELRRLAFYLAAIESNAGMLLLFSDIDLNVSPNGMRLLMDAMASNTANQYILSTNDQSLLPVILNPNNWDKLGIYNIGSKNKETRICRLRHKSIHRMLEAGVAAFLSSNRSVT